MRVCWPSLSGGGLEGVGWREPGKKHLQIQVRMKENSNRVVRQGLRAREKDRTGQSKFVSETVARKQKSGNHDVHHSRQC